MRISFNLPYPQMFDHVSWYSGGKGKKSGSILLLLFNISIFLLRANDSGTRTHSVTLKDGFWLIYLLCVRIRTKLSQSRDTTSSIVSRSKIGLTHSALLNAVRGIHIYFITSYHWLQVCLIHSIATVCGRKQKPSKTVM